MLYEVYINTYLVTKKSNCLTIDNFIYIKIEFTIKIYWIFKWLHKPVSVIKKLE